jgi:hypothetical protein
MGTPKIVFWCFPSPSLFLYLVSEVSGIGSLVNRQDRRFDIDTERHTLNLALIVRDQTPTVRSFNRLSQSASIALLQTFTESAAAAWRAVRLHLCVDADRSDRDSGS